jgi:hypothetical protein
MGVAPEFKGFPKLARLFRTMTITEKIDGTNAAVVIQASTLAGSEATSRTFYDSDTGLGIWCQSRKRVIKPGDDNYGFAAWVQEHGNELLTLGEGYHYGEWWGGGIQRNYGLDKDDKRFSLFNTSLEDVPDCVGQVPILHTGAFDQIAVEVSLMELYSHGSAAVPGFMNAEGVVVYHHHSRRSFKVTLDDEDKHKWQAN